MAEMQPETKRRPKMPEPVKVSDLIRHVFAPIPRMPRGVQQVYDKLGIYRPELYSSFVEGSEPPLCFTDRYGDEVIVPTSKKGVPYFHEGYIEALWDFKNGNLLLEEAPRDKGATLFRRDVSNDCERLDTWHAIASIGDEYGIKKPEQLQVWDALFVREAKRLITEDGRPLRVHHGIRFRDRAYYRTVDEYGDSTLHVIDHKPDPLLADPFELVVDRAWDDRLANEAEHYLRDISQDEDSYHNLAYMPAAPFLQEYKHLTFVLAGEGSNGKGTLFSAFIKGDSTSRLSTAIDVGKLVGSSRVSSTLAEQEPANLIGRMWAFDQDAEGLTAQQTAQLKKLSTGDALTARKLGQNMVRFEPRAVLCVATNLDFVTEMSVAMRRRFAFVRMKDGRKPDELRSMRRFINQYGADGFLMCSCRHWERSQGTDHIRDVQIGMPEQMTEAELWVANQVVERGFCRNTANPYRPNRFETHNIRVKLGLKIARRAGDCVLVVEDEKRFAPYRAQVERMIDADRSQPPRPLPGCDLNPSERGFDCYYVPAGPDKVAKDWKKAADDPQLGTSEPPKDSKAWAAVPRDGFMVLDFDMSKTGGKTGWNEFTGDIGDYASLAFPRTFLVRTPSGGVHAYYSIPEGLHVKNAVHQGGIPIDVRGPGMGYVIAPGSKTAKGLYQVADDSMVAPVSDEMIEWMGEHGYLKDEDDRRHHAPAPQSAPADRRSGYAHGAHNRFRPLDGHDTPRMGRPDMSPIPEGQRNSTLNAWAFGRHQAYPDNCARIDEETYERGRASGLADSEIASILSSVHRSL